MGLQIFAPPQPVPEGEEVSFAFGYAVALGAVPQLGPYSLDLFGNKTHLKGIPFRRSNVAWRAINWRDFAI